MRILILLSLLSILPAGCCGSAFSNCKDAPIPAAVTHARATYAAEVGPPAPGAPAPATRPTNPDAPEWKTVATAMGRTGVARGDTYTITVPRDDLFVILDGNPVPVEAGLESRIHFYPGCCGKLGVLGQIAAMEHELNDVIDALRAARIEVASVGPMLLHTRQAPMIVRFQGEGDAGELAKAVRAALKWTGKERMAPEAQPDKARQGVEQGR
jgi:Domain of Unknown Function (DUF1259)